MAVVVPIFVADDVLLLVFRHISYDDAPATADHVITMDSVEVPCVAPGVETDEIILYPLSDSLKPNAPTESTTDLTQ